MALVNHCSATAAIEKEGGLKERIFWWSIGKGREMRELERAGGLSKARREKLSTMGMNGEPGRIRTCDPLIKSQLLYQLS